MINERIRYPQVRVIDDVNAQLGVMDTRAAIDLARDRGYDLILVAAQAQPPVCRIMDYGKYKYEKSKREKAAHKNSKSTEMKTVRLHPRTSLHDRAILVRHAETFLRDGNKVRVVCQFKGRENAYPHIGREQLDAVGVALDEISTVEGTINKQGREMAMLLNPKPGLKPLPKMTQDEKKARAAGIGIPVEELVATTEEDFERVQQQIMAGEDDDADEGEISGDDADIPSDDAGQPEVEAEPNDTPPEANPS